MIGWYFVLPLLDFSHFILMLRCGCTFTAILLGAPCSFCTPVDRSRKIERRKWSSGPKEERLPVLDIHNRRTALGPNGKTLAWTGAVEINKTISSLMTGEKKSYFIILYLLLYYDRHWSRTIFRGRGGWWYPVVSTYIPLAPFLLLGPSLFNELLLWNNIS